ncbi:subtilisin family serine protease [Nocardioides daedukensis]|uniref:Subtilisin family serine protease n=1 Tax=Nocardioides daedukensis TaxID=634462 RepID=A0A7Y9UW43_9ACTN|nr:subtilisin family serine protease [Nocardioides daedukensis]
MDLPARFEDAWQHTKGEGVVVAVIDSGVEPSGDLQGAVLEGFSVDGKGPGNEDIDRKAYHGTVMSTLIAGRGTGPGVMGFAPEAKILPVQVPVLNQHEYTAEALTKLAALPDPPEVVNMSYGAFGKCSPDEQAAVNAAIAKDMILVAAIGNVHSTSRGYDHERTPASCKGVIAVGAYGFFGNEASGPTIKM